VSSIVVPHDTNQSDATWCNHTHLALEEVVRFHRTVLVGRADDSNAQPPLPSLPTIVAYTTTTTTINDSWLLGLGGTS
jgi:hypothetical protein